MQGWKRGSRVNDLSTVLLIEDNVDDVDLIRYAFGKARVANPLAVVSDGDAAIAYVEGRSGYADRRAYPLPCLFLLDLKLPKRSGFEVLEHIRVTEATRRTPVVVLTSSNQEPDIRQAYDLGANSYLVKPVGHDGLLTMVRVLEAYWIKLNHITAA
jgi:CheY-like chemotaxis protein